MQVTLLRNVRAGVGVISTTGSLSDIPFQIQFFVFSLTFLISPFGSVNVVSHVTLS